MFRDVYPRLVILTIGTLLPFFWIVVILGHRRQRNFERIFFFLCLALVFLFGGSLLALNAHLFYAVVPHPLDQFAWSVICVGLWSLPPLLIHLHLEYSRVRELIASKASMAWLAAAYLPAVFLLPQLLSALRLRQGFDFLFPSNALGPLFQAWMMLAFAAAAFWQRRFAATAPDSAQRSFHRWLFFDFSLLAVFLIAIHLLLRQWPSSRSSLGLYQDLALLSAVAPLFVLLRNVQKFNFLQIGRQRNLLYAVFAAFIGLLYLSLIRRVSQWLEAYLPPEATAALLLFLPVVLFEPLQRLVARLLRRTAQLELDHAHRTMQPIQEAARLGDLEKLRAFAQKWIADQLQLAQVELLLAPQSPSADPRGAAEIFPIKQLGKTIGVLRVQPYGAMLSGETTAALEFLCEQLPSAIDLCQAIDEKLRLERELAQRERLAALGQMAASISHNLKNPLGSIKTILQVQLETRGLPDNFRAETAMVLDEINRLSSKLNQLLQFSRPAVLGQAAQAHCDAREILREVTDVLRPEADRRAITLAAPPPDPANISSVSIGQEALNDILSNLVLNALDAVSNGGLVRVGITQSDGFCSITVEDDGPGIPSEAREKILQPFFTTKSHGTGLGLAIVARRVADSGGHLDWQSPIANSRGTRFRVRLPLVR